MSGVLIFIHGLLRYLQAHIGDVRLRFASGVPR
jgi:hypothetical protein